MAKYKSYYDIDRQASRLEKEAFQKGNYGRLHKIIETARRYKKNIENSRYSQNIEDQLGRALMQDEEDGNGHYEITYRGSTPYGGDDPDEYEFVSDVDHSDLKNKKYRYRFTRNVYQGGEKENRYASQSQKVGTASARSLSVG